MLLIVIVFCGISFMDDKEVIPKNKSKDSKVRLPGSSKEPHFSLYRNNFRVSLNIIIAFLVLIIVLLVSTVIVFEYKHNNTKVYTTNIHGNVERIERVYIE